MKLFISLLVVMGMTTLGCGDLFGKDKEEEENGQKQVEVPATKEAIPSLEEQFEALVNHVSSTYNKVVGHVGTVTVGEASESIGVVLQSNLEGTETIVLAVEQSSSAGVEDWIMDVGNNMVSHQKTSCSEPAMLERFKMLSGAVAVVQGESVSNLTGGIECSVNSEAECNSLVKGFAIKGLGKDEAGNMNSVTLSKEGAEDIVVQLSTETTDGDINLALYVAFLKSIDDSELCANIQKAEEAKAAAEAAAVAAAAETTTAEGEQPAEGDAAAAGEGSAEAGTGEGDGDSEPAAEGPSDADKG